MRLSVNCMNSVIICRGSHFSINFSKTEWEVVVIILIRLHNIYSTPIKRTTQPQYVCLG